MQQHLQQQLQQVAAPLLLLLLLAAVRLIVFACGYRPLACCLRGITWCP
jgi:hypothetical protein